MKMEKLPETINVDNKDNFVDFYKSYLKKVLRENIYIFMLSRKSENEYFDLDTFANTHVNRKTELVQEIMEDIIKELIMLGWKCKYSFADTGLFVYSTENSPPSCW